MPGASRVPHAGLTELEAEERYARERYQLYKAKAYGSRLTSPGRLRELERRSKLAKRRLDTALRFNSGEPDHGERKAKRSSAHAYED